MTTPTTDEPSVLTWAIVLAPQPRYRVGRHWWRDLVSECWRAAYDQWRADLERASIGYDTEATEWKRDHPAPRLSDFMIHLSSGQYAPETVLPALMPRAGGVA